MPEIVVISGDWSYKSGSYEQSECLPVLIFTPYTRSSSIFYKTNHEAGKMYFNNMHFSVSEDKKTFNFYINNNGCSITASNPAVGYAYQITGEASQYNRSNKTYHVLAIGYKEEV